MNPNVIRSRIGRSKVLTATRVMTAASGNVAYTGVGFQPSSIICFAFEDVTDRWSIGAADKNRTAFVATYLDGVIRNRDGVVDIWETTVPDHQEATVASYDSDGFTLTWSKTGLPTGTASLRFLCYP